MCSGILLVLASVWVSPAQAATTPADRLFPETTSAYFSAPDSSAMRLAWEKTQLGQLALDPRMKPFVDSFRNQIKDRLTKTGKKIGLTWDDLDGVPAGELALGIAPNARGKPATMLVVDITGHHEKAKKMLEKSGKSMTAQGATAGALRIAGETVTVYSLAADDRKTEPSRIYHLIKGDMLLACDDGEALAGIIGRSSGDAKDSLSSAANFREVTARVAKAAGDAKSHLRWFVDPFTLVETLRAGEPKTTPRHRDAFKALKNQGYTAVRGIGGQFTFSPGDYEMLHHTVIYAPPAPDAKDGDKYLLAARALDFPNSNGHRAPAWVPQDVTGFTSFNLKPARAFQVSKDLINELANDPKTADHVGFIDDILEGIKVDKAGPQVDIEGDIIANLGTRAVVISDYELPVTPTGERLLLAIDLKDAKKVADAIDRLMRADSNAKEMKIAGVRVWMMTEPPPDEEIGIPATVIVMGGDGFVTTAQEEDEEEAPKAEDRLNAPNSAWAVAHGQLFRASHVDLMKRVLEQAAEPKDKPLSAAADYQRVAAAMDALQAGENSFRFFARTDEQARPTYELLRAGKLPLSESVFGRVLSRLFDDPKSTEPRKQRIDGRTLPEFQFAARFLGPSGTFVTTVEDGWVIKGFTLRKRVDIEVGRAP